MPDAAATEVAPGDSAEAALAFLTEMSPDLRGAAILAADGSVLAASGEPGRWREDAAALFAVADAAGAEPVEQVHVATEQGEVFALRHAGLAAVAVDRALRPRLADVLRHALDPAQARPAPGEQG